MAGCEEEFVTVNSGVTTTPKEEFEITVGRRECREANMLDKDGRRIRIIRRTDELQALEVAKTAERTENEIVSVVSLQSHICLWWLCCLPRLPCRHCQVLCGGMGGRGF
jgi:hypothetical protein